MSRKETGIVKKQTEITKKQYQRLDNVYGFKTTLVNKKRENSGLVYNINFKLNKLNISEEEFNELSDDTKFKHLQKPFFKNK